MSALSEAKLAALRSNARKSAGPKSPAGKAASVQNARKHGFSARLLHVPPELLSTFEHHRQLLLDNFKPQGGAESDLFERILHSSWVLLRIEQHELRILASAPNPFLDAGLARRLALLDRYRNTHDRAYHLHLRPSPPPPLLTQNGTCPPCDPTTLSCLPGSSARS